MAPIVLIFNRLRADSQSLVLPAIWGRAQKTRRVESAGPSLDRSGEMGPSAIGQRLFRGP